MQFTFHDLILSSLLGAICGVTSGLFNISVGKLSTIRNRYLNSSLPQSVLVWRRVSMIVIASLIVAPLNYLDYSMGIRENGDGPLTHGIFQDKPWTNLVSLCVYAPAKFITTLISISLPLPVGLFSPSFLLGGAIGRLYGELIHRYLEPQYHSFAPWKYGVIGAAAFVSGETRTISTSVIVFEHSRHNTLRIPVTAAILMAYFIANRFIKNIYDLLIDTAGVPYLPELPRSMSNDPASEVSQKGLKSASWIVHSLH